MRKIKLTKGQHTIVDDEDFDYLNQWSWHLATGGYAMRSTHTGSAKNGTRKKIHLWMHRIINGTPSDLFTDHINRNRLDNRKSNLRTVTKRQNQLNRGKQKNNTSGYKGVYRHTSNNKWIAQIKTAEKVKNLGSFDDVNDAIKARKEAERLYHAI